MEEIKRKFKDYCICYGFEGDKHFLEFELSTNYKAVVSCYPPSSELYLLLTQNRHIVIWNKKLSENEIIKIFNELARENDLITWLRSIENDT